MIENTENTTPATEVVYGSAYVDGLTRQIAELEQKLSWAEKSRDINLDTVNKVTKHIQDSIDREEWTDEELDEIFWEELADMLDLELTKTVDVIIKAEWSATVKMKRNQSLDDLDISVSEPEGNYGVELDNVYESVFEITEG
jgi:hypothetical protein